MKILNNEQISDICRQIQYLVHAGISNSGVFSSMTEDAKGTPMYDVFNSMTKMADEGASLSDILRASGLFPAYVTEMLDVGEKSGKTEETLASLASECSSKATLDRQLKSALLYPAVLMIIMLIVIAVLLIKVLPIFNDVYSQLGSGLTGIAEKLMIFGEALKSIAPILVVLLGLIVLFLALFAALPSFRSSVLNYLWKIRGEKGVGGMINNAHFAQALALALSSGMRSEEAVLAASKLLPESDSVQKKCQVCMSMMSEGASFTEAMKNSELLPPSKCRLLDAAFKGGNADKAMLEIADKMTLDSSLTLTESMGKIEPVMVTISSLLIGIILLIVMLPLINIMSAIG